MNYILLLNYYLSCPAYVILILSFYKYHFSFQLYNRNTTTSPDLIRSKFDAKICQKSFSVIKYVRKCKNISIYNQIEYFRPFICLNKFHIICISHIDLLKENDTWRHIHDI